jgi:hypothetical protein
MPATLLRSRVPAQEAKDVEKGQLIQQNKQQKNSTGPRARRSRNKQPAGVKGKRIAALN